MPPKKNKAQPKPKPKPKPHPKKDKMVGQIHHMQQEIQHLKHKHVNKENHSGVYPLACSIAMPDACRPLRFPDEAPSETRVLGLTLSEHLPILPASHETEFKFFGPGAMFVLSRQPSRPLLVRTDDSEAFRFLFLDMHGSPSWRVPAVPDMVPGYHDTQTMHLSTGRPISFESLDTAFEVPLIGFASHTTSISGSVGHIPSVNARFDHVGVHSGVRGVFLSYGESLNAYFSAYEGETNVHFSGQGMVHRAAPSRREGGTSGASDPDFNYVPYSSQASSFCVEYRMIPVGGSVQGLPVEYSHSDQVYGHTVVDVDYYEDGTVCVTAKVQIKQSLLATKIPVKKTAYYQIMVDRVYRILDTAGITTIHLDPGTFPRAYMSFGVQINDVLTDPVDGIEHTTPGFTRRWKSVTLQDLDGADLPLMVHTRTTGLGFLCKNMSNALSMGGTFFCRRSIDSSTSSMNSAMRNVQRIEQSSRTTIVPASSGLYTWLPPSRDDMRFIAYVDKFGVPLYHIDHDSPQHVCMLELPTANVSENSMFYLLNINLEFVTNHQRYGPAGFTPYGIDDMSRVRLTLAGYPLFMCNPNHVKKLLETLKHGIVKGGKWAVRNQNVLLPFADAVNPSAGATVRSLLQILARPS